MWKCLVFAISLSIFATVPNEIRRVLEGVGSSPAGRRRVERRGPHTPAAESQLLQPFILFLVVWGGGGGRKMLSGLYIIQFFLYTFFLYTIQIQMTNKQIS